MRHPILPLCLLLALVPAGRAAAQAEANRSSGVRIAGTVYDSLAGAPLPGARVQLVAEARRSSVVHTAISDSLGRFVLREVPDGAYQIGFLHPVLDSLGLEAPRRAVVLDDAVRMTVDLAIPAPATVRAAACAGRADADAGAALVGVVRSTPDQAPVAGAEVAADWLEFAIRPGEISRRTQRASATAGENGWFALCNVPRGGTLALVARSGTDSTDRITVDVPARGFLRRDLYLGAVGTIAVTVGGEGSAGRADSVAHGGVQRTGGGRLHGTVLAADGHGPVRNARVGVAGGPETTTNARGEWVLTGVPEGTRILHVRAIGFFPEQRPVDVIAEAPAVRTSLLTMRAVLDTIRVTASRFRLQGTGFDERRRAHMGRYITAEDIAQRVSIQASDLLVMVPGLRVDRNSFNEARVTMRALDGVGRCVPATYVDGQYIPYFGADDLNAFVHPDDIAGIEIYGSTFVPPEFKPAFKEGCGSLVVWTKVSNSPVRRWSARRRVMQGIGAVLLGATTGVLLKRL